MLKLPRVMHKPEYYHQPHQLLSRIQYKLNLKKPESTVDLPWRHSQFKINPHETIGKSLLHMGVYDLAITEAIHRLVKPKMNCLDVGANIGYFTSLMSYQGGKVYAFEPHPSVFSRLQENCGHLVGVELHQMALSNQESQLNLYVPEKFDRNEGIASLEQQENAKAIEIQAKTIDQMFPQDVIDLMKIDVEGHELQVLKGAERVLNSNHIKNIVFEDFDGPNSETIQFLKSFNYQIYRLVKGFWDLKLVSPEEAADLPLWEPPNYLATFDPSPVQKVQGWQSLLSYQ